jgi:hypothetical protein
LHGLVESHVGLRAGHEVAAIEVVVDDGSTVISANWRQDIPQDAGDGGEVGLEACRDSDLMEVAGTVGQVDEGVILVEGEREPTAVLQYEGGQELGNDCRGLEEHGHLHGSEFAEQKQDDQDQDDQANSASAIDWPTHIEPTAAKQQEQNEQDEQKIHGQSPQLRIRRLFSTGTGMGSGLTT